MACTSHACHEVRTLISLQADRDVLTELPGPAWLASRRSEAARRLGEPALPSTDEEVWRYSRIDELDLADFSAVPAGAAPSAVPAPARAVLDSLGERSGAVVLHNGHLLHAELDAGLRSRGVRLGAVADGDDEQIVGALSGDPADVFVALNDVHAPVPVVLDVPAGVVVPRPVVVIDWADVDGGAVFGRFSVRLGADAEAVIVDWHGSDPGVRALCAPVVELDAGPAARLLYAGVQDRGPRVWQVASQLSRAGADATVQAFQIGLGGDYARTRADCRLTGRGASGRLRAVFFGENDQMLDFRTFQDHAAPDTTSDLLFKGAVGDHSRSVYTGLIRVRKQARGTNAFQTNRNIKLSDGAWAESVPNLEIENNDVRCSHASTVGPVDEEQRFYLESRGVPTPVAERLIVAGFFAEVLDQLTVPSLVAIAAQRIGERLDRRELAPGDGTEVQAGA